MADKNVDFSSSPYYDDYDQSKGFHKILFKPGYSVQARELNQLQEILQQQINHLGTHLFKNGSVVVPGGNKLNKNAKYVLLKNTDKTQTPSSTIAKYLVGNTLSQTIGAGDNSTLTAEVLYAKEVGSYGDYVLAIVTYKNSALVEMSDGKTHNQKEFSADSDIKCVEEPTFSLIVPSAGEDGELPTGEAILFNTDAGVFFCDGYFVYAEAQTELVAWNYNKRELNCKVGFKVSKQFITAEQDTSLYDNCAGGSNENAPGADRFAILLTLATVDLDVDEDFLELVRYENGNLKVHSTSSNYNSLNDTLARRTYDESGDYVVRGLQVSLRDHLKTSQSIGGYYTKEQGGDENKFLVEVSPGKAYVKGYEVENEENYYLEVPKARRKEDTRFYNNAEGVVGSMPYCYILGANTTPKMTDLLDHGVIWLTTGFDVSNDIIGYCVPSHIEPEVFWNSKALYRLYGTFHLLGNGYTWSHLGGWRVSTKAENYGAVVHFCEITGENTAWAITSDGLDATGHFGTSYAMTTPSITSAYILNIYTTASGARKMAWVKNAPQSTKTATMRTGEKIAYSTSFSAYVVSDSVLYNADGISGSLVKLPQENIKTTKDQSGNFELLATQGYNCKVTTNASGIASHTITGQGTLSANGAYYTTASNFVGFAGLSVGDDGKTINLAGDSNFYSKEVVISTKITKPLTLKTKSLVDGATLITNPSARTMLLKHKDIYELTHVWVSQGKDVAPDVTTDEDAVAHYTLVNRDTTDFYETPGIVAASGYNPGERQILVQYKYFQHSAGDVFTVDSYACLKDDPADVDDVTHIARIPTIETQASTITLNDYLDFRQTFKDGFHAIKVQVTNGSNQVKILDGFDYRAVVLVGYSVFCDGFLTKPQSKTAPTITAITADTITISENAATQPAGNGVTYLFTSPQGQGEFYRQPFGSTVSSWMCAIGTPFYYDVTVFTPRNDITVVYKNGDIKQILGNPGSTIFPDTPEDAMCLSRMTIPAFTRTASEITYNNVDNKRYTMRDIGKLETRIENLEYYTTLTLKELETEELKITDANGLDRYKCGFFVTNFKNFDNFNPFNNSFAATIQEDDNRRLTPMEFSNAVDLTFDADNSTNYIIKGDRIFLPYTHKLEVEQPYGTKAESVNPYFIVKWTPSVKLTPENDTWHETNFLAPITNVVNITKTTVKYNSNRGTILVGGGTGYHIYDSAGRFVMSIDTKSDVNGNSGYWTWAWDANAWGTGCGGYTRKWVSTSYNLGNNEQKAREIASTIGGSVRAYSNNHGTRVRSFSDISVEKITTETETKKISDSVAPWVRTKDVFFKMTGAKPNTKYYAVFDETDVCYACMPTDEDANPTGEFGDDLISNDMGELFGIFRIPPYTFKCGTITMRIVDTEGTEKESDLGIECEGIAYYTANGTSSNMAEVTTIHQGNNYLVTVTGAGLGVDPLAQTFFTTDVEGDGIWATKIGVFFQKRDPTYPCYVELREVVNGYPTGTAIAGSTVGKNTEEIKTSTDSSVETQFEFDTPIWLDRDKEYAIVVWAATTKYWVYISEIGEKVLDKNAIVGTQPSLGSLFRSQNASTWTANQYQDLKFRLYRAEFDTTQQGVWKFNNANYAVKNVCPCDYIETTTGSNEVVLFSRNHGLRVSDKVVVSLENAPTFETASPLISDYLNGIPISEFVGEHVVSEVVDIDRFKVVLTTQATFTGLGQMTAKYLYLSASSNYYRIQPRFDEVLKPNTEINYGLDIIAGKDFDGTQTPKATLPALTVQNNTTSILDQVGLVQSSENENAGNSIKFTLEARTTSATASPNISVANNAVIVSSLSLNKPETLVETYPVEWLNNASSKVVSQVITLQDPATSLVVYTVENKMAEDDIKVFYRFSAYDDVESFEWIEMIPDTNSVQGDTETYAEIKRVADNLPEFSAYQIKLVFQGKNSCRHPSVKELRVVAVL